MIKDDNRDIVVNVAYGSADNSAYPTAQSIQVTDADELVSTIRQSATYYKSTGLVQSYTDDNTHTTSYAYDKLGRITEVEFPDHSKRNWLYIDTHNIVSSKDEVGNQVYIRWSPLGWKTEEGYKGVDISGITYTLNGEKYSKNVTYGYDTYGRMSWSKDALLHQTNYSYDPWGRLLTIRYNVDGAEYSTSYDDVNRTTTSQDPEKKFSVIQQLDKLGHVIETRESGTSTNERHTYIYNKLGLLKQKVDYPQGDITNSTTYQYDVLGRISDVTQPAQPVETTQYQYSLAGQLKRMIYPDGNSVLYRYDEAGRRITRTEPNSPMEKTYYDGSGNVTKFVDKNGVTFTYGYNSRDYLTSKISPDETVGYQYDAAGRREWMTDLTGTTSYSYKPGTGELQTVKYPDQRTMSYTYNILGLREMMTDPYGYKLYYTYDGRNRLKGIGPALNNYDVSYGYFLNSQLKTISRRNNVTSSFTYDGPRLDMLTHTNGPAFDYNYDGNSNIQDILDGSLSFGRITFFVSILLLCILFSRQASLISTQLLDAVSLRLHVYQKQI